MATNESRQSLSANKQALLKIRELKQQVDELKHASNEPIAIVSMACRFPRTNDTPERFWESLISGRDEVSEIPADRWDMDAFYDENPDAIGKMYARHGVFLERIDQMDPEFFGISPREATWVDPQQRLLLEVCWEALERACWAADQLTEKTGVFVGWMHNDYQNEASDSFLNLNPYIATGAAGSFLSGRLAYYLGLQGPSLAVDTACSSSLVALHLACQSLQRREYDRALVGGVNAIVSPTTNILTCRLKALSPSGHSRAFDAAADGYLRGEGCGVITLRRLSDAQQSDDRVIGIIRGSAVGHNGFSGGLTAPNARAQQSVIEQALSRAGVAPEDIAYLEAHGTGTELGDPIELQAAAASLSAARSKTNPLLVGSVKTNIGHLEAASGIAGLIKVLLAFEHDKIPAQRNFVDPNPHIPWDRLAVQIVNQTTAWPSSAPQLAGVSAFGMSGTNAHVVVESPHQRREKSADLTSPVVVERKSSPQLITFSGKTAQTVTQQALECRKWLEDRPNTKLCDVAYTRNVGRAHFEHRIALVAQNTSQAVDALREIERGNLSERWSQSHRRGSPRVAFQFTGQGSQYVGMASGLYHAFPLFKQTIDQCDQQLQALRGRSLIKVMFEDIGLLDQTQWTQPALFSIQYGLCRLLESWGVIPDFVLGHSVGQYAAACVAGVMSWDDGLRLISERGRLIGELPAGGKMVAVFAPAERISDEVRLNPKLSIAAYNGSHIVISGEKDAIDELVESLRSQRVRCRALTTSHAFHSHLMEPVLDRFQQVAEKISFGNATCPIICNITGKSIPNDQELVGEYWRNHIRQPVQYAQSVQTLQELGCDVLLELGPAPILTRMAAAMWSGKPDALIQCLAPEQQQHTSLLTAVGNLYVQGVSPSFEQLHSAEQCRRLVLPTYPFQRRRFWGPPKPRASHAEFHTAHPLLGHRCQLAGLPNESRFESHVEVDSPSWLPDHRVMGDVVFPGAAFLEMLLAAADGRTITDVSFDQPLRPQSRTTLQTVVRQEEKQQQVEIYSLADGHSNWIRHVRASVGQASTNPTSDPTSIDDLRQRYTHQVSHHEFYQRLDEIGLQYGPLFQTVHSLAYSEHGVLARLKLAGDLRGFNIPPNVLDGALHSLAVGVIQNQVGDLFLPVGVENFTFTGSQTEDLWCHANWDESHGDLRIANLSFLEDDGREIGAIKGLKLRRFDRAALRRLSGKGSQQLLYGLEWQACPARAPISGAKKWLIVDLNLQSTSSDYFPTGNSLKQKLIDQGHQATIAAIGHSRTDRPDAEFKDSTLTIDDENSNPWESLLNELESIDMLPDGIVWLLGSVSTCDKTDAENEQLSDERWEADTERQCTQIMSLLSELRHSSRHRLECGIQFVTHRAIDSPDVVESEDTQLTLVDPTQTQYWGLGRVLGAEHPELRCRLIDVSGAKVDDSAAGAILEELASILLSETSENQLAINSQGVSVPRLSSKTTHDEPGKAFDIDPQASYLITGGLGQLGQQACAWLARQRASHLVLVSRRAPDDSFQEFRQSMATLGSQIEVCNLDISNAEEVENLLSQFGTSYPRLAGIIHAAGVLDDELLIELNWGRFRNVLLPKVMGARLLDRLTSHLKLDFFILYSSAASVLGSPGQSNYATANAYLDGLAWRRMQQGKPTLSLNWGPWTEGMADDERIAKRLSLQGITPLSVDEAHQAMVGAHSQRLVQATVIDADWRKLRMGVSAAAPNFLEKLAPQREGSALANSELVRTLSRLQGSAKNELLIDTIQNQLQEILGTPESPETDRPLIEMGLDSLMAVEFGTRLQEQLGDGFNIAPTMLFDYPTIDAISGHVLDLIGESVNGESSEQTPAQMVPSESLIEPKEDVAIIGMGCRFPGAPSLSRFWSNLIEGVDSVGEIPADRWDVDRFYSEHCEPGKMISRQGGFLDEIGEFDAEFFNIADTEASWIDPQHRLMLEVAWEALEDAGIAVAVNSPTNAGVFMGIMSQDYAFLPKLDDAEIVETFQGAGLSHSAGVGRLNYLFGFEGPSLAIDTASSSSLVAVIQAVRSLQQRQCDLALAGGVNAILAPINSLLMSKAELMSPDGRCHSFSAKANGFGRGEGCGVVALKRLSDARRDGDRVLAVLRGGAISHNGQSVGLTSPNSRAQSRVIADALQDARIPPASVQYLEAHGTGTEFGDPIELTAATAILGKGRPKDQPLLVGSVKANISHLEAAGGISGLIKTVLAMENGVLPPQLHFEQPSPHLPWKRMPVQVVQHLTTWPEAEECVAGVTALGLSGTNAHVIISRPKSQTSDESKQGGNTLSKHILTLSARTDAALRALASSYIAYLKDNPDVSLQDVCHTAARGRKHFECRAAIVTDSRPTLLQQLSAWGAQADNGMADEERLGSNGHSSLLQYGVQTGNSQTPAQIGWLFGDSMAQPVQTVRALVETQPFFQELIDSLQPVWLEVIEVASANHVFDLAGRQSLRPWFSQDETMADPLRCEIATAICHLGLGQLWKDRGVEPDLVMGVGLGQYSAACFAGGLVFEDAFRLIALRALLHHARIEITGASDRGLSESDLQEFERFADKLNYFPANRPTICSLDGQLLAVHKLMGGTYWRRHAEQPAKLDQSIETLLQQSIRTFFDFSAPDAITSSVDNLGGQWLFRCQSSTELDSEIANAIARLYVNGWKPDPTSSDPLFEGRKIRIPTYPFQRKRYWITDLIEQVAR